MHVCVSQRGERKQTLGFSTLLMKETRGGKIIFNILSMHAGPSKRVLCMCVCAREKERESILIFAFFFLDIEIELRS